jgi:type IV pilus assembly protein PilQ
MRSPVRSEVGRRHLNKSMSFLAAALTLALCMAPAHAQAPNLEARVNLRIADQTIEDVVAFLRERSGANIVVIDPSPDKRISDVRVSIDLTDVPWRDALEIVAEKVHGVVEERAGAVLAVTRPTPITIEFKDVDIMRVVDPKTLQEQLETHAYQLRYLRPKSSYKPVIKSEFVQNQAGASQSKGGAQDFIKTFSVLQALQKSLSSAGQIDYIDTQNVVIIRDTSQVHDEIKDMLQRLDIEPQQVFCDVKFVSTTNADVLNLGVDYGDRGPQIGMTGGQIPITLPFDLGPGGWDDWIIASPSGEGPFADPTPGLNGGSTVIPQTIFGALSFTQVQATLRLLQRDTKTEVIQAPKLIALDGNEATIFVGETIRYAEAKSEQGQAGGLQLSVAEAQASPVEVGFQLLIRPNIIPGTQKIVMEVIPKETSLSGSSDGTFAPIGFEVFTIGASGLEGSIALPRTRSSTIVTTMMLETGQTAVIGGLTSDTETETKSEVPYLSKIPLLGELFKYKSKNHDRRSLMVFITPTIVHSSEDTEFLLRQELLRRQSSLKEELQQLFNAYGPADAPTEGE